MANMAISRKYLPAVMLLVSAAGVVVLRFLDPATSGIFPPCPLHYLTGWYCPGCGSLRAIHQLLQGNLREAWAMNPLTILLLPFLTYGLASEALVAFTGPLTGPPTGKRPARVVLPAAWIRALCAVIVLFGIARNCPFHPLNLLAPGAMLHL